jgi:hypothetical protein
MAVYTKINKKDIVSINDQFEMKELLISRELKKELKIQITY